MFNHLRTWPWCPAVVAGPLLALTVFGCSKPPTTPTVPAPVLGSISPASARPNQVVTIRGSGFQPGAVVSFGGVSAFSSVAQTGTAITVTTPVRSAGLVDIVVINPDGQRASLSAGFTVLAALEPPVLTATMTVSPSVVSPGGELTVAWAVSRPSSGDWIGLFKIGVPSTSYEQSPWAYVAGLSGSLVFTVPSEPGEYEVRYLPDDGYDDIARAPVTIR